VSEELYEEFEDDDFEDFEEFDEEDERTEAINREIADFERQHGVELDAQQWQHIGTQIDLYRVTPEEAFARTDEGRDDERFVELAQRIAITEGRDLTTTEIERLAELDERAELRGEDQIDASEALYDLSSLSGDGVAHYIAEKLAIPPEREEPSANVIGEDGSEKPGYDLDDPAQASAAIDALMAGEDVAGYDSTYETESE
jgi:hypothetical protein